MDISNEFKKLRAILPKAMITAHIEEKHLRYECDLRHAKITPEEHDSYFEPIKQLFGSRLLYASTPTSLMQDLAVSRLFVLT